MQVHATEQPTVYLFDLDGTLTATELLPLIARDVGLEPEMAELTAATMSGEVPFDASFRRRVELLSEIPVGRVVQIVQEAPLIGPLMDWVADHREQCWVVTGNLDCWVRPWLDEHGLRGFTSTARVEDGRVRVGTILRKESVLTNFPGLRTVMVGDGANDAELIAEATIGIASAIVHAVPRVVLEVADFVAMDEEVLCRTLSRL